MRLDFSCMRYLPRSWREKALVHPMVLWCILSLKLSIIGEERSMQFAVPNATIVAIAKYTLF